MPEMMNVPAASGLVSLAIDGLRIDLPQLDDAGRLWLQQRMVAGSQEDRVEVKIHRLLDDTIPMQVTNLLRINVSGQAREVKLEGVLLDKAEPMSMQSPLPARLLPTGELLLQVRPGRWEVRMLSRFDGPVLRLGPVSGTYGQEVWSFQAQNQLRMVQIEGVSGVDPKQTDVPKEWEKFPAYILSPDAVMTFKEIRRGDPDPAPDMLNLRRTWWLDFAGTGFTIQDQLDGTMSRQWYLAMNPPGLLGRVSVDGSDQLITSQGAEKKAGVELRKGHLNLVAESRYEASRQVLPAVGWDHDFQSVSGVLNLPPGWRLLSAGGVDVIPGTWFERWTLLDLFVVLIIALAVFKLWNWRWGLLALLALGLTYHEPGAPRLDVAQPAGHRGLVALSSGRMGATLGGCFSPRCSGFSSCYRHSVYGATDPLGDLSSTGTAARGQRHGLGCGGGIRPGVSEGSAGTSSTFRAKTHGAGSFSEPVGIR